MEILGVIPARYASTRFPGKPLVIINGKSMIQRVYEQSQKCNTLKDVIVATDSEVIERHVKEFGGRVVMTSEKHNSGTERCAEVVQKLGKVSEDKYDVVINIQGDEPFIDPEQISQIAECLSFPNAQIATLAKRITSVDDLFNPNVVKVVIDLNSRAIYFSRAAIPYFRGADNNKWLEHSDYFKHVGIYGYRTDVLKKIATLSGSSLEKAESLEQLRWIENGFSIHLAITESESISIDVPEDLLKITNMK